MKMLAAPVNSRVAVWARPARQVAVSHRARAVVVCAAAKPVPVTFQVGKKVGFGTQVHVVGGEAALGQWTVDSSPALVWSEGDVWKVTVPMPAGSEVEFKFVVAGNGKEAQWESIPNRTIKASSPETFITEWDVEEFETKEGADLEVMAVVKKVASVPASAVDGEFLGRLEATLQQLAAAAVSNLK